MMNANSTPHGNKKAVKNAPDEGGAFDENRTLQPSAKKSDLFQDRSRVRDVSILLTVFGVLMLGTTLPRVFLAPDLHNHILQTGLLIFGFWLILICAAFLLSNRLLQNETNE